MTLTGALALPDGGDPPLPEGPPGNGRGVLPARRIAAEADGGSASSANAAAICAHNADTSRKAGAVSAECSRSLVTSASNVPVVDKFPQSKKST